MRRFPELRTRTRWCDHPKGRWSDQNEPLMVSREHVVDMLVIQLSHPSSMAVGQKTVLDCTSWKNAIWALKTLTGKKKKNTNLDGFVGQSELCPPLLQPGPSRRERRWGVLCSFLPDKWSGQHRKALIWAELGILWDDCWDHTCINSIYHIDSYSWLSDVISLDNI